MFNYQIQNMRTRQYRWIVACDEDDAKRRVWFGLSVEKHNLRVASFHAV